MKDFVGLCHRCEHRATFKEKGLAPRCECGSNNAVYSCYMYRPVAPLVLEPKQGERRSLLAMWTVSGRAVSCGPDPSMKLATKVEGRRCLLFWKPGRKKGAGLRKR
jgi:hypothetical protein